MLERFIDLLQDQLDPVLMAALDGEQIADMLWLTYQRQQREGANWNRTILPPEAESSNDRNVTVIEEEAEARTDQTAPIYTPESLRSPMNASTDGASDRMPTSALPYRAAAAAALRNSLALGRALRPLMQKVRSRSTQMLDEVATAEQIAETQTLIPVLQPVQERRWDVAVVVEETRLSDIWQQPIAEFQQVLTHLGAFRDVRIWTMRPGADGALVLLPRLGQGQSVDRVYHPKTLIDPSGRRLILVISDCTSQVWWAGQVHNWLKIWAAENVVSIVQLLPDWLWAQGVLGEGEDSRLRGRLNLVNNRQLLSGELPDWSELASRGRLLKLPIVTIGEGSLHQWAQMVVGQEAQSAAGALFDWNWLAAATAPEEVAHSPEFLVRRFMQTASVEAKRLVRLMAAAPVNVRVVEVLQAALLPESEQCHVAEIWMSGLVQPDVEFGGYDFGPGVRALLLLEVTRSQRLVVLNAVSRYVGDRLNTPMRSFAALLTLDFGDRAMAGEALPLAMVALSVLEQMGEDYWEFAQELRKRIGQRPPSIAGYPTLQAFNFETVTIEDETTTDEVSIYEQFEFEVATIAVQESNPELVQRIRRKPNKPEIVIRKRSASAWQVIEPLGEALDLEMVVIPGGTFMMGSPQDELDNYKDEQPQHEVTVPEFWMGKYPVTQAQWRFVAGLPQVNCAMEPDPANFKGEQRPIEQVSWWEAVEFCDRLSKFTGLTYRLPSEAEWEYACRAGTTDPFHFGETIDAAVANYRASEVYGKGRKGEYREETTIVGNFEVANPFGLFDMHGNVWEWCADHWHDNYEGAPIDGSIWLTDDKDAARVSRGGSWIDFPRYCRSAYRYYNSPDYRNNAVGFRVMSSPQDSSS
jgi:formylglycine-generating enzyme required for sulfatase activity